MREKEKEDTKWRMGKGIDDRNESGLCYRFVVYILQEHNVQLRDNKPENSNIIDIFVGKNQLKYIP